MRRSHRGTKAALLGSLEVLEARDVPSTGSFVYTETENPTPNENAVVAFAQTNGQLTEIGSYNTDGTGFVNDGNLGPQDSDKEVIASPDGRFVYAVNQGSNTVAVFSVQSGGSLTLVNGAPFGSGGTQPVSLGIAEGRLYVLNRGDEQQGQSGSTNPTITVFNIAPDGALTQDVADTTTLPVGLSPSQVLTTPTSNLLFVDAFTPPTSPPLTSPPDANEVLPFQIGAGGELIPAPSGGLGDAVSPPLLLGLTFNPTQNIIYASLTGASGVGVFTFDATGDLTLVDTVADTLGGGGPCWTAVSPNGKWLYTADTGTNSVGVYSLADPTSPTQIQEFSLSGSAKLTTDFEFAFDPTGNYLYVIDHEQNADNGSDPQGNALHILSVASNGMLSEAANSPAVIPGNLPVGDDPQGVAVIPDVGPGATVVGSSLYLVGGGSTNDQVSIAPTGSSQTGSTGVSVNGQLDGMNINNQTFTGITNIYVEGFGGNDNIQFAGSLTLAAVIAAGDGNDNIQLDAGANVVTLGKGSDNVQGGNGTNIVTLGNGNDNVQLGNGNNTVALGAGNDNVQLGNGSSSVAAGAAGSTGNINVQIGNGANNSVMLMGNGNDQVQIGNGDYDDVMIAGNGNDQVQIGNGYYDYVAIVGSGNENVQTGTGSGTVLVTSNHSNVQLGSSGWTEV